MTAEWRGTGFDHLTAHHRSDLGFQQFDDLGHFIERHPSDIDLPDEALATYESELQKTVDTVLFGRVTHQGFESYWPQVALDPASPKGLVEYAQQLNAMRKIVFSKTLTRVEWNNATLIKEIVPEDITQLRHEPGRDMVIYGSASVVRTLTNLGSIDQYQLLVYPVVLGSGKPLFQNILHKVKLSLVSTETHPSGVVVLSYQPIKE